VRIPIKGQEVSIHPRQFGGHVSGVVIHGKVDEAAIPERFARVAAAVLGDGVMDVLRGEAVFEFDGEDGQAVEGDDHIQRLVGSFGREVELADDGEAVGLVACLMFGVAARGGTEVGELQVDAVEGDAVAQDFKRAAFLNETGNLRGEGDGFGAWELFAQFLPLLGLGGLDEFCQFADVYKGGKVERGGGTLAVHGADRQRFDDVAFA